MAPNSSVSQTGPCREHRAGVRIVEVGRHDGLQNEAGVVSVEARVALIEALAASGLPCIEV